MWRPDADATLSTRVATFHSGATEPVRPKRGGRLIEGVQVGHLSRDVAIVFGPVAVRIRELGSEARCAATIGGGSGVFGVLLELGTPDECLACLAN